jgi:hypothetical protein
MISVRKANYQSVLRISYMMINKKLRVMYPVAILQNFINKTDRKTELEPIPVKKTTF